MITWPHVFTHSSEKFHTRILCKRTSQRERTIGFFLFIALLVSKSRTVGNKDSSLGLLYCGDVDQRKDSSGCLKQAYNLLLALVMLLLLPQEPRSPLSLSILQIRHCRFRPSQLQSSKLSEYMASCDIVGHTCCVNEAKKFWLPCWVEVAVWKPLMKQRFVR